MADGDWARKAAKVITEMIREEVKTYIGELDDLKCDIDYLGRRIRKFDEKIDEVELGLEVVGDRLKKIRIGDE